MPKKLNADSGFAEQLRAAIVSSGLTHYRIAKDAGIKPDILDRFVSGERDVRLHTAEKIGRVLGLTRLA